MAVIVEVVESDTSCPMTIGDYIYIADVEIMGKSKQPNSQEGLLCNSCDREAWGQGLRAPLLPLDFEAVCPEYKGKCPRCGGELRKGSIIED